MKVFSKGKAPIVADIVFIHGLQGDDTGTWTKDQVCWPRDLLAEQLPDVRLLSWNYDASVANWRHHASSISLFGHTQDLLGDLGRMRKTEDEVSRPIIFVGHSLDGLVIKEALITAGSYAASVRHPDLGKLHTCTKGVIFMGTPHRGSAMAKYGVIVARIAKVFIKKDDRLLKTLEEGSDILEKQRSDFDTFSHGMRLVCLYEAQDLDGVRIVPEHSACFEGFYVKKESIPADHINMCKFKSTDDVGYKRTVGHIMDMVADARKSQYERDQRLEAGTSYSSPNGESLTFEEILDTLRQKYTDQRYQDIPEPHKQTFQWIWKEDGSGFVEWLKCPGGIFWIQGKAGSGKSTLMKYLTKEDRTRTHLAGGRVKIAPPVVLQSLSEVPFNPNDRVCLASFFFSAKGSTFEQSLLGLLASVVSQILGKFPASISAAFPTEWEIISGSSTVRRKPLKWSVSDLQVALRRIAQIDDPTMVGDVCLFIDGLDEYHGDHADIVEFLEDLILESRDSRLSFKACIASRPLSMFESRFKKHPGLRLQDLTASDIRHYVTSKLNRRVELDRGDLPFMNSYSVPVHLVDTVVQRSSGVFLWVTLVVKSLETGLNNGDDFSELVVRVNETPADIQDLYLRTILSIDTRYRGQAADYLRIIRHAWKSINLLTLALASDGPARAMERGRGSPEDQLLVMCHVFKKRLSSRCGALVGMKEAPAVPHLEEHGEGTAVVMDRQSPPVHVEGARRESQTRFEDDRLSEGCNIDEDPDFDVSEDLEMRRIVDFVHLSVREFLASPISKSLDADRALIPDPYINLIGANLSLLKLYKRPWDGTDTSMTHEFSRRYHLYGHRQDIIKHIFLYGRLVGEESWKMLADLLDNMDVTMQEYTRDGSKLWFDDVRFRGGGDYSGDFDTLPWPASWRSNFQTRSDLSWASTQPECRKLHTKIVRFLLEKGARPNLEFQGKTAWQLAVAGAYDEVRDCYDDAERNWCELLQILLDFGANPDIKVSTSKPEDQFLCECEVLHDDAKDCLYREGSSLLLLTYTFRDALSKPQVKRLLALVKEQSTIDPDEQALIDAIKPLTTLNQKRNDWKE